MTLFVEIIYVLITVVLILVVLLQAGRGGGLGTALGGGASQSVFGGGGGADFLAKLTQGLAIGFMVCAVYLAYAGAHTGSDRLKDESKEDLTLADDDSEIDYERLGPTSKPLPVPGQKPSLVEEPEPEPEPDTPPDADAVDAPPDEEPEEG